MDWSTSKSCFSQVERAGSRKYKPQPGRTIRSTDVPRAESIPIPVLRARTSTTSCNRESMVTAKLAS
eukprot:594566-Pleurochrysis_carterae.AAC.4